jgi:hypothetical protein
MNNDELKNMIESYFDGELDKNSEPVLFTMLSGNPEGRQYFKQLHALQVAVTQSTEPFPDELEQKIFHSIKAEKPELKKNIHFRDMAFRITSIAAALFLFVMCSLFFLELKDSKIKLESITEQLKDQKETMNVILNYSLPAVVINPDADPGIIIRANSRKKI